VVHYAGFLLKPHDVLVQQARGIGSAVVRLADKGEVAMAGSDQHAHLKEGV
jgi:hypothetical protein